MGISFFGRERVHLGAHEADLLAHAHICRSAKLFLPQQKGFSLHKTPRNSDGTDTDPHAILYL